MKKNISLIVAFALFVQSAFAAPATTAASVEDVSKAFLRSGMTLQQANEYVQAHVSPAEYARIAKAIKDAKFAGTLNSDLDKIVASVNLQKATGNYLHGDNYDIFKNAATSVSIVAVVGLIVSAGGATSLATGKLYEVSAFGF